MEWIRVKENIKLLTSNTRSLEEKVDETVAKSRIWAAVNETELLVEETKLQAWQDAKTQSRQLQRRKRWSMFLCKALRKT